MFHRSWRRRLAMLALTPMLHAGAALAAERIHAFDVPQQPLRAALVQMAIQADVSISTGLAGVCAPRGNAVTGRLTLSAALTRLLEGTGCGYRMVDAHAVEILPARALAESPAPAPRPAPPVSLDQLLVVATRHPTPADRLAYAVSALESHSLTNRGIGDVGDFAAMTPSMTVTNLGPGRDKILIRGLSDGPLTGRTQSMVGVYLDDVRLTYNAPDPDLRLIDMTAVEVLRGPQGALYGAGSQGGVVHLVTAPPEPGHFGAWLAARQGWTHGGAGSSTVDGMLNLPLPAGRGAVRLVGYRETAGGYIADAALGLGHANQTLRIGGRLSATLELDDRWTATAGVVGQGINSDDSQYAFSDLGPYTRRNQVREPHDNDFAEANLGLRGELDRFDARWTTGFVRHRLVSRYDASASPPVPTPPGPAAFDDEDAIISLVSEATLSSKPATRLQWLAGAFYSRSRQNVGLTMTSLAGPPMEVFGEVRHDRLDEAALFGEIVLPLVRRLSVTVGGRAFLSDAEARSGPGAAPTGPARFSGQLTRTGFAPKIVLAYRRSDSLLAYVQAAEGYRAGGINTSGPPGQVFSPEGGPEPNRFYQGDQLWSFEAGVRASALGGRLVVRSALFATAWRNIQSDELLTSGLPFTANIGDGRNNGWEFEGRYTAGRLVLEGHFLIDSPELSRANPAFPARPDLGLAGVPDTMAGASMRYEWPLPRGLRVELDGRYAYVGGSRLTFDAITSPRMGDYSTGRVSASLAGDRWRLTAALDNPSDARSNTFAYGNPFTLRTTPQTTPLRPTTAWFGFSVSY